jgi:SagB-type dehydrogenase family enzyme
MLALASLLVLAVACRAEPRSDPLSSGAGSPLPPPATGDGTSLTEALASRRSVRSFTGEPLTPEETSQLLWAAQGVTASWGGRTAPSAGALYPIEIFVADAGGVWRYLPDGHGVERVAGDRRAALANASGDQAAVADAPTVFVIAGVVARTEAKYADRADRYVALEAGHVCQNLLLQATALGLGAVPVGAFSDGEVLEALGLTDAVTPLYLVPVGHADA